MTRGGRVVLSTLIALPMFLVLLGLGAWQLQRLQLKLEFLAARDVGFAHPPAELTAQDDTLTDLAWRRVTVTGRFDHAGEFHLFRTRDGSAGYEVLTPLVRTDGAPGQVVLVDRGWVPLNRKDAGTRAEAQVEGVVTVNGFVRIDLDARSMVTPVNDVVGNIWYVVDYAAMGTRARATLRPLVVVADATANPGGFPIGVAKPPELPNNHLGYAFTWFSLAAALAVIWGISLRRQLAAQDAAA